MSTVIGIVTFGNLKFTELAIKAIRETTKSDYKLCVVVGKPGDHDTAGFCARNDIPHLVHGENYGFPFSINDLYDFTWGYWKYDNLIIVGNDVLAYPFSVDSLIKVAETSDYEQIGAYQYDVRDLCRDYPEAKNHFESENYNFKFSGEPWKLFTNYSEKIEYTGSGLSDIQNMALYKKSVFDKIGYVDVGFWPGGYFSDNDYAMRMLHSGIKSTTLRNAVYFHFWSRTIHQSGGGSTTNKNFENNKKYYINKWGGEFKHETIIPELCISSRELEGDTIKYWKNK